MNKLTAIEAALLSNSSQDSAEVLTENILKMIEKAALEGERCIYLISLSARNFNELIALGYTVTVFTSLYTVSW